MRKMRRWIKVVGAACVLAGSTGASAATPPLLDMRGCELTVHVFMDDVARVQPAFVPAGYTPLSWVPDKPWLALWSTHCDAISVRGRPAREAHLSIAAVAIQHPDKPAGEQLLVELPNLWSHYVHRIYSDDAQVVRALRRQGFPARRAADMTFERTVIGPELPAPLRAIAETRVGVPGAWSSWTRPPIQHEPEHSHSNTFYREGDRGTSMLELRIPLARDHFCELAAGEQCGTVAAERGSAVADLLGGTTRSADAAIDHDPISRGVVTAQRVDSVR